MLQIRISMKPLSAYLSTFACSFEDVLETDEIALIQVGTVIRHGNPSAYVVRRVEVFSTASRWAQLRTDDCLSRTELSRTGASDRLGRRVLEGHIYGIFVNDLGTFEQVTRRGRGGDTGDVSGHAHDRDRSVRYPDYRKRKSSDTRFDPDRHENYLQRLDGSRQFSALYTAGLRTEPYACNRGNRIRRQRRARDYRR